MEVYKVEIEAPDIDFCWYFIFVKSKESAIKIYEEYSKFIILPAQGTDILKLGEYRAFLKKFGRLIRLPGITSSSKIEGIKVDLTDRSFSWKKS